MEKVCVQFPIALTVKYQIAEVGCAPEISPLRRWRTFMSGGAAALARILKINMAQRYTAQVRNSRRCLVL